MDYPLSRFPHSRTDRQGIQSVSVMRHGSLAMLHSGKLSSVLNKNKSSNSRHFGGSLNIGILPFSGPRLAPG